MFENERDDSPHLSKKEFGDVGAGLSPADPQVQAALGGLQLSAQERLATEQEIAAGILALAEQVQQKQAATDQQLTRELVVDSLLRSELSATYHQVIFGTLLDATENTPPLDPGAIAQLQTQLIDRVNFIGDFLSKSFEPGQKDLRAGFGKALLEIFYESYVGGYDTSRPQIFANSGIPPDNLAQAGYVPNLSQMWPLLRGTAFADLVDPSQSLYRTDFTEIKLFVPITGEISLTEVDYNTVSTLLQPLREIAGPPRQRVYMVDDSSVMYAGFTDGPNVPVVNPDTLRLRYAADAAEPSSLPLEHPFIARMVANEITNALLAAEEFYSVPEHPFLLSATNLDLQDATITSAIELISDTASLLIDTPSQIQAITLQIQDTENYALSGAILESALAATGLEQESIKELIKNLPSFPPAEVLEYLKAAWSEHRLDPELSLQTVSDAFRVVAEEAMRIIVESVEAGRR